jgi:hypothetical protein
MQSREEYVEVGAHVVPRFDSVELALRPTQTTDPLSRLAQRLVKVSTENTLLQPPPPSGKSQRSST